MKVKMNMIKVQISSFLILLMAYYIMPEHYLLLLHPHEHKSYCCAVHAKEGLAQVTEWERQCAEKENYKQVFDNQLFFQPQFNPVHFKSIEVSINSGYFFCFEDLIHARAPPYS